jgi:y4mF family transcriptional regulator
LGNFLVIFLAIIPFRVYIWFMKNIGETVKDLRKRAGLDQVEFARRAGVGLRFLRELEQGKATVRLDKVSQVLDFLGHHIEVVRNGGG